MNPPWTELERLTPFVQCGDRDATERWLRGLERPLFRYLARLCADPHRAEDVLQETLHLVYRKVGRLRDPGLLRPWAYRIAGREAARRTRRERARVDAEARDDALATIAVPADLPPTCDLAPLGGALRGVSTASRAVLALHYGEELPLDAVAAILEIPVGTAKSRLFYGLAQLRRRLASSENDHG
jgi:RNA polymerase sigma-70 factor, ECF subfamily